MDTLVPTTVEADDELADLDTPDWRNRNADLRSRYISAQDQRDTAAANGDEQGQAAATRTLENLGREFYELNQGLALASARRFSTGAGSIADYQAAAALGLWEAFTRWDPSRGVAFSTFSRQYVNGRIQRSVRQVEYAQLSQSEFSLRKHIRTAANTIAAREQRAATVEEIAEAVGEKPERVLRTLSAPNASLETPIGDGNATLGDLIADEQPAISGIDNVDDLEELLDELPDLEAWILAGRSGAYGGDTPSLLELSGDLGIGREIARRAETRGRLTLARRKLERDKGEPLDRDELAEALQKTPAHLRKYLVEPDLDELRRRWTRTSDLLAIAKDRGEQRKATRRLETIGRAALALIERDAVDASGRYADADGSTLSADEAACELFAAFLQWDPSAQPWKTQARNRLNQAGTRRRRHGDPDRLDQENTWNWLKGRHIAP